MWRQFLWASYVSLCSLYFSFGALAQDVPLEGKVKDILIGSWVKVDGAEERAIEIAQQGCTKLMLSEEYQSLRSSTGYIEEVPAWKSIKGDLAFFEQDGRLFVAGKSRVGFKAAVYDYPRMITYGPQAYVIGIHTWDHSPTSGYYQTTSGKALETTPVQLAVEFGLVDMDHFLIQLGEKDGVPLAVVVTNVKKDGSRTESSIEYTRCGDIASLLND